MDDKKYFCFSEEVAEVSPSEGMTRKVLSYSKDLMVCELHFDKGADGSPHKHAHQQISYVVSGVFEAMVGDEKRVLKAGDTVYDPSNMVHGVTCIEEGILLDIFTPMREDFI